MARILVVDDIAANRELLKQELEEEGYEVLTAPSGERALELAANDDPWVIMLDWHMPGMDGVATCRFLKANPTTAKIPVMFITARRPDESVIMGALAAGANDFITKPYEPADLFKRLDAQVKLYETMASLGRRPLAKAIRELLARPPKFGSLLEQVRRNLPDGQQMSVVEIAADQLKERNNRYGYESGDLAVVAIAGTLSEALDGRDVCAAVMGNGRWTFVVAMPPAEALQLALDLATAVERGGHTTISAGVSGQEAASDSPVEELGALLRAAGIALDEARAEGNRARLSRPR